MLRSTIPMITSSKTPNTSKLRKQQLIKKRLINCSICPVNRGENASKRRPKDDRGKNHRRGGK